MTQYNKIDYLPNLIQKTRSAHIEAERRLLRYDRLSKWANVYYACLTVLLSLLSFYYPNFRLIAFMAICISITLTVAAVFASMQSFGSRAIAMKYSYHALHKLWLDFDNELLDETLERRADRIGCEYLNILQQTENHTEKDYIRAINTAGGKKTERNSFPKATEDAPASSEKWSAKLFSYIWNHQYDIKYKLSILGVFLFPWVLMLCLYYLQAGIKNVCS